MRCTRLWAGLAGLGLLCILLFRVDWAERKELTRTFPGPGDGSWRSLSLLSNAFATYWYEGGAWNAGLQLNYGPYRFGPANQYGVYTSYPSGFLLPVHLVSLVKGEPPSPVLVMQMSLWLHLLTAFLAAAFAFLWSARFSRAWIPSFACGAAAAGLYLFSPAALHFYPATWWADTLAPTWVLLLLLQEFFVRPRLLRRSRALSWLLDFLFFFLASFTDWLLPLVAGAILVHRWRRGRRLSSLLAGTVAAFAAHLLVVAGSGKLPDLWEKAAQRIGLSPTAIHEVQNLDTWHWIFEHYFGRGSFVLFCLVGIVSLGCLGYRLFKKAAPPWTVWMALIPAPFFLHNLLLLQHYKMHSYNVLKWALVLALAPALLASLRLRAAPWAAGLVSILMAVHMFLNRHEPPIDLQNAPAELVDTCSVLRALEGGTAAVLSPDLHRRINLMSVPDCYFTVQAAEDPETADGAFVYFHGEPDAAWKPFLGAQVKETPLGSVYRLKKPSP